MFQNEQIDVLEAILTSLVSSGVLDEELFEFIITAVKQKAENKSSEQSTEALLTRHETADFLRCSLRNVDRLLAEGMLPCVRFGGSVRIRKSDISKMLAGGVQNE